MSAPLLGEPCAEPRVPPPLPGGRPIRVVLLLATGTNGGAQEHAYTLLSRLDQSRYQASVVSLSHGSTLKRIAGLGFPVLVVDEPDDAVAVGALAAHLVGVQPDVLHNHMYRAELVGTRAAIALEEIGRRRPYVLSTVHSSRVRSPEDREQLRRLTPRMDRLIAVSRAIVAKIANERGGGAPVSLIYNGVDLARYDHQEPCCTLREEYGLPADAQLVGVVARLEPEKGHPTLLEAWPAVVAAVPSARLLVVGEGSRCEALKAQSADLAIDGTVVFAGRRDDVPAVTAALDVAVLPSYREAQGVTILEAMALSRPVVASAVGGIPEMIDDGRSGLLVPPHDPPALAAAIIRLLQDHAYADMLGRGGHDLVHERFCVELMVQSIESIYDEAAALLRRPAVAAAG